MTRNASLALVLGLLVAAGPAASMNFPAELPRLIFPQETVQEPPQEPVSRASR